MTKIMLVEDDKSLREIYGVRLLAEGYDIVSAGDGEEALAMAIKERPGLIISDVMMPKVSGYDMLDILRSTTETKGIQVIMMTALSSEEQRARAESLGADRYLVKSQVGIEDVVNVVHEVLGDGPTSVSAQPQQNPVATPTAAPAQPPRPAAVPPRPVEQPAAVPQPVAPPPAPVPVPTPPPKPVEPPKPASLKTRVIQPLGDPTTPEIDINELLDRELAKEAGLSDSERPAVATTEQEKALVEQQLSSFTPPSDPEPVEAPDTPVTTVPPTPLPTPGVNRPTPDATPQPLPEVPVVPAPAEPAPQPVAQPIPIEPQPAVTPQPVQQPAPAPTGPPVIPPAAPQPAATPPVIPPAQNVAAAAPVASTPPPLPEVPTIPAQ